MRFTLNPGAKVDLALITNDDHKYWIPINWPDHLINGSGNLVHLELNALPFHLIAALKFVYRDASEKEAILTPPHFNQDPRIQAEAIDWWEEVLRAKAEFVGDKHAHFPV